MSDYSLPKLPDNVRRLIEMEPTREHIDAYIQQHSISNILSGENDSRHTLCGALADARDADLKSAIPGFFRAYGATLAAERLPQYLAMSVEDKMTHANQVMTVCHQLAKLWKVALAFYSNANQKSQQDPAHTHMLCLVPYTLQLPSADLIREYERLHDDARPLILLTARHELGHIYQSVLRWHKNNGFILVDEPYLTPLQWDLLAVRQRGTRLITIGQVQGEIRRSDAPMQSWRPTSDIATLYWLIINWAKQIFDKTLEYPLCKDPLQRGCKNRVPIQSGRGARFDYCPPCASDQSREKGRERVERYRSKRL